MKINDIYELHGRRIILASIGHSISFFEAISGRKSSLPVWYIKDYGRFIGDDFYALEA